jgi:hypothetical protein
MLCRIETKESRKGKWKTLHHFFPAPYAKAKELVDAMEEYGNGPFRIVCASTGTVLCVPKPKGETND